jgi:hypothetical protein
VPSSWPPGWVGLEEERAASFEEELRRELAPGHPLYERGCIAIGKREATDDVLFAVGAEDVAVVHLTWTQKPEPPPWPSTTLYTSLDEFLAARR